jgi:hypothetical protein
MVHTGYTLITKDLFFFLLTSSSSCSVLGFDLCCSELFGTRQHEIAQFAEELQSQLCGVAQVVAKRAAWEQH